MLWFAGTAHSKRTCAWATESICKISRRSGSSQAVIIIWGCSFWLPDWCRCWLNPVQCKNANQNHVNSIPSNKKLVLIPLNCLIIISKNWPDWYQNYKYTNKILTWYFLCVVASQGESFCVDLLLYESNIILIPYFYQGWRYLIMKVLHLKSMPWWCDLIP